MTAPSASDEAARDTCLVLCLKAPHRAKRRLATDIGELATAAAGHLSDCAMEDLSQWPGPACFAPQAPSDEAWLRERIGAESLVVLQAGRNLGERINHVDRALRHRGVARSIFVGADCPSMDSDYLLQAAQRLAVHDVVLGPAFDGGVVLMGANAAWPDLSALPWSSDGLFEALKQLCEESDQDVAVLDPRMDVDTLADLAALDRQLQSDQRPARRALVGWLAEQSSVLGLGH